MTLLIRYNNIVTKKRIIEFIEFIGRIADLKFKGTSEETTPLNEKIEIILDDMLPAFNLTRKDVDIKVEEHSESDDDY